MKYRFLILGFLALSIFAHSGFAENKSRGWLSAGIGGSHFGPCFYGSFTYSYENNLFTVRYFKANEFVFNVDGVYDKPFLACREFGILYGMSYVKANSSLSFFGRHWICKRN
jgi:glucose-6-phosphate isomerase